MITCSGFDPLLFWDILFSGQRVTWYYAAPTMHHALLQVRCVALCVDYAFADRGCVRNRNGASLTAAPSCQWNTCASSPMQPGVCCRAWPVSKLYFKNAFCTKSVALHMILKF